MVGLGDSYSSLWDGTNKRKCMMIWRTFMELIQRLDFLPMFLFFKINSTPLYSCPQLSHFYCQLPVSIFHVLLLSLSLCLPPGLLSSAPVWSLFCQKATTLTSAVGLPWLWASAVPGQATRSVQISVNKSYKCFKTKAWQHVYLLLHMIY